MILRAGSVLAALVLLASCSEPDRSAGRVRAEDHDAFFLWAGVRPPPVLDKAKTAYLLAGEIRAAGPARFVPLRATPRAARPALWLVVRAERLDWGRPLEQQLLDELARWDAAGNRVIGLQVDFDAATRGLGNYAQFLEGLRQRLPRQYQLSVTGLMDWGANGDPAVLARLAGIVDEVVVQTYQGRSTIPGYAAYFDRLARLPVPHRIALIEGGEWQPPRALQRDPQFRGYVVFLVNP